MNKRSKFILICITFILLAATINLIVPGMQKDILLVSAQEAVDTGEDIDISTDTYGNGEYAITKYKVDIYVNEDNTFRITESIEVYFSQEQRGIIREIPIINEVTRLDKSKSRNRAKIKDITVSENFTTKTENGYKKIRIGDENATITGYHDYIIAYTYDIGNDNSKRL